MAKEYFERLSGLVDRLGIEEEAGSAALEVRHLFSGAALYVDGTVRVSWSPGGPRLQASRRGDLSADRGR